jgi:hypothetical protein
VHSLYAGDLQDRKVWRAHPLKDQAFSIFRPVDCTLWVIVHTNGLKKEEALHEEPILVVVQPDQILVVLGRVWLENALEDTPMAIWQGFSANKDRGIVNPDGTANFMDVWAETPYDNNWIGVQG